MGNVFIFRGKAATGKTTLSNLIARELSIPIFRKDDIVDALKTSKNIRKENINNEVCYNILYRMIQTNLDLKTDFILDIALGDKKNAECFFQRLNFHNNKVIRFFLVCSNENEWKRRHMERLLNPQPNQSFQSFEHVLDHYRNSDTNPFDDEYIVDNVGTVEESFTAIMKTINSFKSSDVNI